MTRLPMLAVVLAFAGGCLGSDKAEPVSPPTGDGKGDVSDRVEAMGTLLPDSARTGAFDVDLAFHGYRLQVRAGARLTLDNTNLGTAATLDTTLFVYGPKAAGGGYGDEALAFDDDSGWGRHARIRSLTFSDEGEYLVVLGTATGRGRGHYRLEARCENGQCAPAPVALACDDTLAAGLQHCMAQQIADGDLEADTTVSYEEALATCSDGEALGAIYDAACASQPARSYCGNTFEGFVHTEVPPCTALLEQRFGLCGEYLVETLTQASSDLWFTSESDYPYDVVLVPGVGAPSAANVLELSGLPSSTALELADFDRIFSWRARAPEPDMDANERTDVQRHRHLRRILEANLTNTLVVRLGAIEILVYLVGQTACGELAGLSTTSIET